jgi:hypothetical protein
MGFTCGQGLRLQNGVSSQAYHIFETLFYLKLTTDHCRYVRRPEEDYGIKDRDPSLVKSRQEGGFEEVDFVVDSFVELADAMKGL